MHETSEATHLRATVQHLLPRCLFAGCCEHQCGATKTYICPSVSSRDDKKNKIQFHIRHALCPLRITFIYIEIYTAVHVTARTPKAFGTAHEKGRQLTVVPTHSAVTHGGWELRVKTQHCTYALSRFPRKLCACQHVRASWVRVGVSMLGVSNTSANIKIISQTCINIS